MIIFFRKNAKTIDLLATKFLFLCMLSIYMFHVWLCLITKQSGDTIQNQESKPSLYQNTSIYHWNLNSTLSHNNFIKLSLLWAYIAIHKCDIVCLSETILNTSMSNVDDSSEVPHYNLFRADHTSNTKQGGICIYKRNDLPLKIFGIHYLQQHTNFQIIIGGKLCRFVSLCHLPNQSQDDFESFLNKFE